MLGNSIERRITMKEYDRISVKGVPVGDENFGALCICAIRYCIGRQSYMPGLIQDYLRPLLSSIDTNSLKVIRRDIKGAENLGNEKIDKPGWMKFLGDIERELVRRR